MAEPMRHQRGHAVSRGVRALARRASIPGRARAEGRVEFRLVQLRDFTHDRHHTVDDYAFGGGAGMVLKPEPFFEAVESLGPAGRAGGAAVGAGQAVRPRGRGAAVAGSGS